MTILQCPHCALGTKADEWDFYEAEEVGAGGMAPCPQCGEIVDVDDVIEVDEADWW